MEGGWKPRRPANLDGRAKAFEGLAEGARDPAIWFNVGLVRPWLNDNAPEPSRPSTSPSNWRRTMPGPKNQGQLAGSCVGPSGWRGETDYLEHRAFCWRSATRSRSATRLQRVGPVRPPLIVVNADREQGIFSALILEDTPDLGVGVGTGRPAPVVHGPGRAHRPFLALSRRYRSDRGSVRSKAGPAVTEPKFDVGSARFGDVVAEVMLFPTREGADPGRSTPRCGRPASSSRRRGSAGR